MLNDLSVIIPVGPDEDRLPDLVDSLRLLPDTVEILFVTASPVNYSIRKQLEEIRTCLPSADIIWIRSENAGRSQQMNSGVQNARNGFLWFLHADSKFSMELLTALNQALKEKPDHLHYFKLAFMDDCGSKLLRLNERSANMRSGKLKMPFGDQGLCIAKKGFVRANGYPEGCDYGEDHLFVWHARQLGIQLNLIDEKLYTSARKYQAHGWIKMSLLYQYRTWRQAIPEYFTLIFRKGNRS